MTLFDYAVIVITALSVVLGCWRGFAYEALSLLGWLAAYLLARWQAVKLAALLPVAAGTEVARIALAFVMLFVATLIVGGIVAWLVSKLVKWAGLGLLDKLLGGLFGMLRGGLLVLALVLLAGLTSLPGDPVWRDAMLSKQLESVAQVALGWLPDSLAQRIHYGIQI